MEKIDPPAMSAPAESRDTDAPARATRHRQTREPARRAVMAALLAMLALGACHRQPAVAEYGKLDWKDDLYLLDGRPFTGLAQDKFPNGRAKCEYPVKEGRFHGEERK